MEITKKLAEFIVETTFEDIPWKAINVAKQAFLDTVGVTLAGSISPAAKICIDLIKENGGNPRSSIIGGEFKTSAPQAALVNGVSAHSLDYDDANLSLLGHPSVFLLPTIMALGEDSAISGREALEAYVVGFESSAKIGRAINTGHCYKGWHCTGTIGTLGAAAAGAKVLNLDRDQTRIALGIAASQAAGLRQNYGTMTKLLHAGDAARNGTVAAKLAKSGFTANKSILESEVGFFPLYCGDGEYDLKKVIKGWGQPFDVIDPGINVKPYPACRGAHAAVDAIFEIAKAHPITIEAVEGVEVKTHPLNAKVLMYSNPSCGVEGKFSMEYCVAIAILKGRLGIDDFSDELLFNPQVQALIKKVKVIADPTLENVGEVPSIVKIRLKDGSKYTQRIDFPKGNPNARMTREELIRKYRECAAMVMSDEAIDRSIDMLENMETISDLRTLGDVLICSYSPTVA